MWKRTDFEMQFQLVLVSVFFKRACVKGHGDSSSRLLEKPYQATLKDAIIHFPLLEKRSISYCYPALKTQSWMQNN